ncbi:hypothetical protein ACLQ3K_16910 [Tsukamurella sp. DT100]|uniref:hypothetical protein n=1 Tax=Tsukamurella sp. DT100 TaxID=3393415 RepID=UPI003CEA3ACA
MVVLAFYEQAIEFQPTQLMLAETEVVDAVGYTHEGFDEVITAMASGLYDLTGWVRETDLDLTVEAIQALRAGSGAKVLIRAGESRTVHGGPTTRRSGSGRQDCRVPTYLATVSLLTCTASRSPTELASRQSQQHGISTTAFRPSPDSHSSSSTVPTAFDRS